MNKTTLVILSLAVSVAGVAQDYSIKVTRNSGQPIEIPVDNIDRVEFVPSDKVDFGSQFTSANIVANKTWKDLGWSGNYKFDKEKLDDNWYTYPLGKYKLNRTLGDVMGMPAFCGHDNIVVFARAFALAGGANVDKAFKVFDPATLAPKGELNLGTIDPANVVAVASDWQGNMIAAVGRKSAGKSDLYLWTSPEYTPKYLGTTHISVEVDEDVDNAASYINVAGDLTGDAVIVFGGPRDEAGTHYKYKVLGGKLSNDYQTIETGYSSADQNQFQMISYFGISDTDPYLVGDCYVSTRSDKMEDEVGVYLNGPDGKQIAMADYYNPAYNGWVQDNGDAWWNRSGQALKRPGGRRPTVHAMNINGRNYAFWTTGSYNSMRTLLTDSNLSEYYTDYGCFWGFGKTTKEMVGIEYMWRRDCYGSMADWYFDNDSQHGYIALWADRVGLIMFEINCVAKE